tara:strand:- start:3541 stop:4323 length:783 start_codon:yes stop_codon:yes gene_type:complete
MSVFIVSHKIFNIFLKNPYKIIFVGENALKLSQEVEGSLTDRSFKNNISVKNKFYSELSALYVLRYFKYLDYIGLVHYGRRFLNFDLSGTIFIVKLLYKILPLKIFEIFIYFFELNDNNIKKILINYDIILPKKICLGQSIYDHYSKYHYENDIKLTLKTIKKMYPDYYETAAYCFNQEYLYPFNMFISNKDIFEKYYNWIFSLLFEIESSIDLDKRSSYQKRAMGFISERLLTVYVIYNKLRIKELPTSDTKLSLNCFK